MRKRILAVVLVLVTVFSLTACKGESGNNSSTSANNNVGSSAYAGKDGSNTGSDDTQGTQGGALAADHGETYNIIMQIVTFGQEFPGIADVENAINAITEPEIGVTVALAPVAAWDLPTTSALEITSNEKLDLMCILPMSSGLATEIMQWLLLATVIHSPHYMP